MKHPILQDWENVGERETEHSFEKKFVISIRICIFAKTLHVVFCKQFFGRKTDQFSFKFGFRNAYVNVVFTKQPFY